MYRPNDVAATTISGIAYFAHVNSVSRVASARARAYTHTLMYAHVYVHARSLARLCAIDSLDIFPKKKKKNGTNKLICYRSREWKSHFIQSPLRMEPNLMGVPPTHENATLRERHFCGLNERNDARRILRRSRARERLEISILRIRQ